MTCREKLKLERPERVGDHWVGGCQCCPDYYGYLEKPANCTGMEAECRTCWDREIPEETKNIDNHTAEETPTTIPTYPVKKATDDYIDPIYITIHTNLVDDPAAAIAEAFKYAHTIKDRVVNISIQ